MDLETAMAILQRIHDLPSRRKELIPEFQAAVWEDRLDIGSAGQRAILKDLAYQDEKRPKRDILAALGKLRSP